MEKLPQTTRDMFLNGALASEWYPVEEAIVLPTQIMSELCYGHPTKGAYECGRYSAEISLKGIYKFYVKMSSPKHIIDRASRVLQAYYEPSELKIVSKSSNHVTLHILRFPTKSEVADHRLAGWMEKALEISGCNDIKVNITKSLSKGDRYTEFAITWN